MPIKHLQRGRTFLVNLRDLTWSAVTLSQVPLIMKKAVIELRTILKTTNVKKKVKSLMKLILESFMFRFWKMYLALRNTVETSLIIRTFLIE